MYVEEEGKVKTFQAHSEAFSRYFSFFLVGFFLIPLFYFCFFKDIKALAIRDLLAFVLFAGAACFLFILLMKKKERFFQQKASFIVQRKLQEMEKQGHSQGAQALHESKTEIHALKELLQQTQQSFEHERHLLHSSTLKNREQSDELRRELEKKSQEHREMQLVLEDLKREYAKWHEEATKGHEELEEGLLHKDSLLGEYQRTISEQRMVIEKKQRYIHKLEAKVRDLMYEIRSLLQLEESVTEPSVAPFKNADFSRSSTLHAENLSSYDLSMHLQRYIQMAQNFTGVDHLGYREGNGPRFSDVAFNSYAIDWRRLFDLFREETHGIVFVYSQVEGRFLFINNGVKTLLGWSSDRFMKDFPQFVGQGYQEWRKALSVLPNRKETQFPLALKTREGTEKAFHCLMGIVPKGPFANHVVGILAPAI